MKQTKTTSYSSLYDVFLEVIDTIRAPERLSVSEAAAKYRYVYQPGAYVGPWKNSETPYMVEPMDMFASREKNAIAIMMSAQTGKTDGMVINTVLYSTVVDPMDMLVYNPTQSMARDFSIRRIDRLHLHSRAVGEQLLNSRDANNVYDKQYKNGTILSLSHPAPGELAGRPVGRVVMTDYDRFPMDVGGEGSPFDLGSKRTTTFGSLAMTVAESSPSMPITDAKWIAASPHEAPPCDGIANLYNRGDRRLWYWPCPHCDEYFEGRFEHLRWDKKRGTNMERARTVVMACPNCGSEIEYKQRKAMQQWGMWVPEGMEIDAHGNLTGTRPDNLIASYWLKGVAAAFVTWENLVFYYLNAEDEFQRTMSEEALKKFWNTDMGMPYLPKSMKSVRSPDVIKSQAISTDYRKVPLDVRFLIGTVDVQKDKFVCQVWGIRPGKPVDMVLIDRFDIVKSTREDDNGDPEPLDPAGHIEDWHTLTRQLLRAKYELIDGTGTMAIKLTLCDSGGRAGVTSTAYNYYRELAGPDYNLTARFLLIKGRKTPNTPRVVLSYPDSTRKDRTAGARGEIPVLLINTDMVKDTFDNRLSVQTPGKGMVVHPDWLSDSYYRELCVEVRTTKGWVNENKERNEAWDLGVYCIAGCLSQYLSVERIDWDKPPVWAEVWEKNTFVELKGEDGAIVRAPSSGYDWSKLGSALA